MHGLKDNMLIGKRANVDFSYTDLIFENTNYKIKRD